MMLFSTQAGAASGPISLSAYVKRWDRESGFLVGNTE